MTTRVVTTAAMRRDLEAAWRKATRCLQSGNTAKFHGYAREYHRIAGLILERTGVDPRDAYAARTNGL